MATLIVEGSSRIQGQSYVFARLERGPLFELVPGTSLGSLPLDAWLEQPRATNPDGSPRTDLYAFRLLNPADHERIREGERVQLTFPGPTCRNCGTNWALPAIDARVLSAARSEKNRGLSVEAMGTLQRAGAGPRASKAAVLHIAAAEGACHRCRTPLALEVELECPKCSSFNYQW